MSGTLDGVRPPEPRPHPRRSEDAPATLHLHLQTGFRGDRVEIEVDGASVVAEDDVTTSLLTGLAAEADVAVGAGPAVVRVTVGDVSAEHTVDVAPGGEHWLAVSVEESAMRFIESGSAFGYA